MEKSDSKTYHILKEGHHFSRRLFFEGLLVGAITGLVAIVYRLLLEYAEVLYFAVVSFVKGHLLFIIIWFLVLILIGIIVSLFLKFEPYISGSGIPQVEAEVQGYIDQTWYKVLISKMIAGALSVVGGLSLGREGPSIQFGAMIGKAVSHAFHRIKIEERFLLTCGAAAGLSAAFNAPLAGIMFSLEEVHKNFSTSALVSVMCASLTGDFLSRQVFGLGPSLHLTMPNTLPLNQYGWLLVLGILTGLLGIFYNKITMFTFTLYEKIPLLKSHQKIIIPLLLSGVLGLYLPQVTGGGHALLDYLNHGDLMISTLFIFFVFKFLFSVLCFGSGAPGGIFFPLLILGSLIGALFGQVVVLWGGSELYMANYIIFAMAGFFASIVRAPLTGIVLIAEMSGSLKLLLPIALVAFVAYIVAESLHSEPIYESLLHRLVPADNQGETLPDKDILSFVIGLDSPAVNQTVASLKLPSGCLLVSVRRGQVDMTPHGDTQFHAGDQVILLVDGDQEEDVKKRLRDLFTFSS